MNIEDMDLSQLDFMNVGQQMMNTTFGQFRAEHGISNLIDGYDFEDLLTKLVGLTYQPELHSNLMTTEAMIHQCFLSHSGENALNGDGLSQIFDGIHSTYIGAFEDPAEDTMVGLANSINGSFMFLNGLWESSCFYAQIFIDLIDEMPDIKPFLGIKESVRALLTLSHESISKTNLNRYQKGSDCPQSKWDFHSYVSNEKSNIVSFCVDDLHQLGISESHLKPFVIERADIIALENEDFGCSSLERKPIYKTKDDTYILALPTAVSVAIRLFVIEQTEKLQMLDRLQHVMQHRYVTFFGNQSRLLGKINNVPFSPLKDANGRIVGADALVGIDDHRYVQFLMFFDDFQDYQNGFVNGASIPDVELESAITRSIKKAHSYSSHADGFQSGLSVLVGCGWGRSVALSLERVSELNHWHLEFVSAPDLDTFNRITSMSPDTFWRLIEAKHRVFKAGIHTQNVNGLLNLYGWAKDNDFNIIPHSAFEEDLGSSSIFMMITQNALLDVRWEVQNEEDRHRVLNPYGELVTVRRLTSSSYFKEDRFKPIYGSEESVNDGQLLGLIEGRVCTWWCTPLYSENQNKDFLYRVWHGICNWIYRADVALVELGYSSSHAHVCFNVEFEDVDIPAQISQVYDVDDLSGLIKSSSYEENGTLHISCQFLKNFFLAFHRADNIAERSIVKSLLAVFIRESVECDNHEKSLEAILNHIFVDDYGKEMHLLTAQSFLDYVKSSLHAPLALDRFDDATIKIGLAWFSKSYTEPCNIYGKTKCTDYLNGLTLSLWEDIQSYLRSFNKKALILFLLENYAAVEADTEHWQRTFKAILGIHKDREDAYSVALERISSNNFALTGSRILIEMAICESLDEGGKVPNRLDISRLITFATAIFQYGNLSDAIMYELVKPQLRLSTYGDVQFDHTAYDTVVKPYGHSMQTIMMNHASDKYDDYFSEPEVHEKVAGLLGQEFESAWQEEFGVSIDEARKILDAFENLGIEKSTAVYEISCSELFYYLNTHGVPDSALKAFIDRFTLPQRPSWMTLPPDFRVSDISPWRFRRRLSLTARPLIMLDDKLVLAPNLIRRGVLYCLSNSYDATLDGSFFTTRAMKKWVGEQRNKSGHRFNQEAADKFSDLGWKVEADVKVSKILNKRTKKDFGDVDVLAWNSSEKIVYLVECKDLEFAKTEGEIAKQVHEFRGVKKTDGKPDRLMKHLERFKVLSQNIEALKTYLKADVINEVKVVMLFKQKVPVSYDNTEGDIPVTISFFDDISG
ncbi:hypothetical protein [Vibrio europaeus]|uniref:Zinc chelation protein SecC n=1 Tax=Vibrio europaeus TaxID=300876 RepID=A0A178J5D0_9VIBR|nr:hypothetical protein [Vibrio europaeus]MDC5706158.1 hypothetical protein [Vibrio europaeus]MDC5709568.1 hypothetical protein [Vibrio europaeus]MDC5713967.1 hypothetical protein [Vibrio europaeus]MDC5723424.1 hypothetical protein [Vibrio europaeus]MDC5730561.1 hypothetical protein [Vibrio europaeus]